MKIQRIRRPWYSNKIESYTKTNFDKFYNSTLWRRARNAHIAEYPLCAACAVDGVVTPGNVVDHILPRNKGGADFDPANLQTLCYRHHAQKSAKDK